MAYDETESRTCPNCGRTVTDVNLHEEIGTCAFCDVNKDGVQE